jgi:hypothetical protein
MLRTRYLFSFPSLLEYCFEVIDSFLVFSIFLSKIYSKVVTLSTRCLLSFPSLLEFCFKAVYSFLVFGIFLSKVYSETVEQFGIFLFKVFQGLMSFL